MLVRMSRRRLWPLWVALLVTLVAGLGVVAFPTFYIMPFRPQAGTAMQWALTARTFAPTITAITSVLTVLLAAMLVLRLRRWWSRGLALLVVLPMFAGAWFARQNHFEWMFNPLPQPTYSDAAKATFVHDTDVVMAIVVGKQAVAYQILQLAYHHLVNDVVAGEPVVATY